MTKNVHTLISIILGWITWHVFLKKHPVMQEEIKSWEEYLFKKLFGE